ncbi:hypothetical protein P7C71_g5877, partial [Lecanoromycetidae sp. Uapishka_2]
MTPTLLGIAPEIRCLIYHHLFTLPSHEILGLSREPEHDYNNGPPSDWIAGSRQEGLVYSSQCPRKEKTNSSFLRTNKFINQEATPIFYGSNRIKLYAEDNNDMFYWLLDIGERNRRAIRHLEIGWAYGVSIESGRGNIHGILEDIQAMEDSPEEEIKERRMQLITVVKRLEEKTVRLIIRTLSLLVSNQSLISLAVFLPGVDGGDIWDLHNPDFYFAEEIFSNSTSNVHACIPEALSRMFGIRTLTIGYTKDIELAEKIARLTGAKELEIETCPEGRKLFLNDKEQQDWRDRGWRLEGKTARKTLLQDATDEEGEEKQREEKAVTQIRRRGVQRTLSAGGYSEGGRLKAIMQVKGQHNHAQLPEEHQTEAERIKEKLSEA